MAAVSLCLRNITRHRTRIPVQCHRALSVLPSKWHQPKSFIANNQICFHSGLISYGILKSRFPDVEIPLESITEYSFKHIDKYGERPALIDGMDGRQWTFLQLRDSVHKTMSGLVRHGFKTGDTIMFLSENSPEYVILFHAVVSLGCVVTTCNPAYPTDDVVRQVEDAKPSYIFASPEQVGKAREVAQKTGKIKAVFADGGGGDVSVSSLLADDGSLHPGEVEFDPREKVAILPYSSGTTGLPKGVMLTHYGQVANTVQGKDKGFWCEFGEGVMLGVLPFYHIFGIWTYFHLCFHIGQTLVVLPGFQPEVFLQTVEKYKVSTFFAVPPMILFLSKHPLADKYDLSSIKRILVGAAPLGEEVEDEFKRKYPKALIGQGYGMTETAPLVALVTLKDCGKIPGSIGDIVANTQAKFVDPLTKEELELGQTGELCVQGPQVMKGYLNRPEATANTIDKEGWLHTGDIGYVNEDGKLYVVDRVKELIKYKGLQVPPAELEALLCTHPAVADAGVIGVPDEEAGELPRAFVQLKPNANANEKELIDFVADKVVAYKKLRGGLEFIEVLPRTPSGKILRRELKGLLKQ